MNVIPTEPEVFESTYALIIRSEEKQRGRLETLVYTLLIISGLFALSQFGREAMTMPANIMRISTTATAMARPGA
jgi:hypothetical protein